MNEILLANKYKEYAEYVQYGLDAIHDNNFKMPPFFYPNEMYHSNLKDCWDFYENEKYVEHIDDCIIFWSRVLNLARRIHKLNNKRKQNIIYCNKSDYNLKKLFNKR